jgi:hypothetical protein
MKELLWQRKGSPEAPSSMKEERRTLIANPSPPPDQGEQDNTVLQQEDSLCAK